MDAFSTDKIGKSKDQNVACLWSHNKENLLIKNF